MKYFIVFIGTIIYLNSFASTIALDSLKLLLTDKSNGDTTIFELYKEISLSSKKPKEKLLYAQYGFEIGNRLGIKRWMASSKHLEAYAYGLLGQVDSALFVLYESKRLYQEVEHSSGLIACQNEIARVQKLDGNFEESEKAFLEAIKLCKKYGKQSSLIVAYVNLGELYRKMQKCEKSLDCFIFAEALCKKLPNTVFRAYIKGNIGLVFTAQNELDSAEIYLNKSIEILEPLGDNYAVSSYLDGLAEVYFKRKQYLKAKQTSLKSLQLAQEHGLKEQIRDASLRLSTIYNQSKEFEKAFFHHKQYVAYRDSINNEETIRKIVNLRTKYEVAQKQKEVDQEKVQKERYLIVAIAAVSILIILTVLVFIILKISHYRKKVNLKLKDQRQELANANATKNKFFSILSHDLRSPLATFHSYSEVMDLCASHQDLDKLKEISGEMKSSSANMLDLLDNLLQWGVNQMGTKKSVPANVSLKDVVLMEVKHLQHVSDKKNIIVLTPIEKDVTLFVDRVKLAMAVRNLLNNSIKFTPSGGTITISSYLENTQTILKVSDTGVGMTPEQRDRLFDFTDINSTYGTQNEKGVGLGMQLVCEFVKLSNASIKVESELGVGTTFIITFYDNVN